MKIFLTIGLLFFSATCWAQNDICPLKVGEKIPSVELSDIESKSFDLNELCKKPTVLIFFRGGWCGYCSKHLSGIQDAKEEIENLGFQIIAITPDQPSKLSKSITKSDLEYTLLSDDKAAAIKAFGLAFDVDGRMADRVNEWSGQDLNVLPVPSVYIIDKGEVIFNYVNPNYKTRLLPATLVSLLKTIETE